MTEEELYKKLVAEVEDSRHISVALNDELVYIAVNTVACDYLKIKPGMLIGKSALDIYPEITASRNHRNILKALSGQTLANEQIESRMGDILITSYRPVLLNGKVKAVVIVGKLQAGSL